MASFLEVLVTVAGTLMSVSYLPQGIKLIKNKSSKNISITTFSLLWIGILIWLLYGISISNFPIIWANSLGLAGVSFVIVCYFIYKSA